jgi:hypothetical protein
MDQLAAVFTHAVPATVTLLTALLAFTRRLAGIGALRHRERFPHPGVPRLWGVAAGFLLYLVVLLGAGKPNLEAPAVLAVLAVVGAVPFGFARVNVYALMRRQGGRIAPGEDWAAARRGEALGFAALGLFGAAGLSPVARHLEAAAVMGLLAGLAVVALWRGPLNYSGGEQRRAGARVLMGVPIALVVATCWVLGSDALPHADGVPLAGSAATAAAGYLLAPRCRPLRRALETGLRGLPSPVANAAALLLALSVAGGATVWALTTVEVEVLVLGLGCLLAIAAAADVVVHGHCTNRKGK